MAATKKNPYIEGKSSYYSDETGKYKNNVLVPESNYKYLPSAIGGTRGVTAPVTNTNTDPGVRSQTTPGSVTPVFDSPVGGSNDISSLYSPETEKAFGDFGNLVNEEFDYNDVYQSAMYKSQRQEYDIASQEAFQNTLGELSSITGGRPSSAAVSNAAAASNRFQQQFASNVLPSLTEQAYNMHQGNISNQYKMLSIMMDKDLTEYEKEFELRKYEWEINEDNPDNQYKILTNKIKSLELEYLPEELRIEYETMLEELDQYKLRGEFLPEEYKAKLAQYNATLENTMSQIESRKADDQREADADKPTTPEQEASYNTIRDNLVEKYADDLNKSLRELGTHADHYKSRLGEKGYNNLKDELNDRINNPKKYQAETEESPAYKDISSNISDMMGKIGETTEGIDADNKKYTKTTYRESVINNVLDTLKDQVLNGIITDAEAQQIAKINGISDAEMSKWENIANASDF